MSTLLISGTAIQAGKSTLAAALGAYWQTYASERLALLTPAAPPSGGDRWMDLAQVWQQLSALSGDRSGNSSSELPSGSSGTQPSSKAVLLELPGELGTPLTPEATVADLAWDWRLPTVLVVPMAAGMVGQAIAHVALARQERVHLKGIVLNQKSLDAETPADAGALIHSLTQVPLLGMLPYLADTTDQSALATAASGLDLERLFSPSLLLSALVSAA